MRKAFEAQRSVGTHSQFNDEHCRIYGVEILWPVILIRTAPMNRVQFPTENATGTEGVIGSLQAMLANRSAEA